MFVRLLLYERAHTFARHTFHTFMTSVSADLLEFLSWSGRAASWCFLLSADESWLAVVTFEQAAGWDKWVFTLDCVVDMLKTVCWTCSQCLRGLDMCQPWWLLLTEPTHVNCVWVGWARVTWHLRPKLLLAHLMLLHLIAQTMLASVYEVLGRVWIKGLEELTWLGFLISLTNPGILTSCVRNICFINQLYHFVTFGRLLNLLGLWLHECGTLQNRFTSWRIIDFHFFILSLLIIDLDVQTSIFLVISKTGSREHPWFVPLSTCGLCPSTCIGQRLTDDHRHLFKIGTRLIHNSKITGFWEKRFILDFLDVTHPHSRWAKINFWRHFIGCIIGHLTRLNRIIFEVTLARYLWQTVNDHLFVIFIKS